MQDELPDLPSVAAADYIDAIALHVSSVCVITTALDGEPYGLTATAVASVSAEPPRLLVCVNKSGFTHDKIVSAGRFCVNVLTEDQARLAMVFAGMRKGHGDRFEEGDWTRLVTGAPVLKSAAAVFDCILGETCNQSSHDVFFGDVVAVRHQTGRDTLLYGARRFRQLRKIFEATGDVNEYL